MLLTPNTSPVLSFPEGQRVATMKSLTTDARASVFAGPSLVPDPYSTREMAFGKAYAASLGAEHGAMLVGHGPAGWFIQPAYVQADGAAAPTPLHFEQLAGGAMPILAGGVAPGLVAIIDGERLLVPRR